MTEVPGDVDVWVSGMLGGTVSGLCPRNMAGGMQSFPMARGPTWQSSLWHRAPEHLLRELGLVVILVCHCHDDLHWLLHWLPIFRHGVGEELQGGV